MKNIGFILLIVSGICWLAWLIGFFFMSGAKTSLGNQNAIPITIRDSTFNVNKK